MNYDILFMAIPEIFGAVPVTLIYVSVSLAIGFVLAIVLAVMRLSPYRVLSMPASLVVYLFRSTPLLVQLFLIYYGSGQFRGLLDSIGVWFLFREAAFCALLALALNTGTYTSEIIRGGILSVGFGQIEAARAIGMSTLQAFRRIIFPQALRQALPGYGNEVILMVKSSSLISTITILDITGVSKVLISQTFAPIEVFIVAGSFYLGLNFIVTRLIWWGERRLSPQLYR